MNREIKFRVWDNKDYMSSPFTFQDIMTRKIEFTRDCTVSQFAGLKDKHEKDIYEGDVCRFPVKVLGPEDFGTYDISPVEFKDGAFYMNDGELLYYWAEESEIIGNIYENPELLNH